MSESLVAAFVESSKYHACKLLKIKRKNQYLSGKNGNFYFKQIIMLKIISLHVLVASIHHKVMETS